MFAIVAATANDDDDDDDQFLVGVFDYQMCEVIKLWFEKQSLIKYKPHSAVLHIHKVPISMNWEIFS